eukprot:3906610-Pyramimonas_sp.AAC.1
MGSLLHKWKLPPWLLRALNSLISGRRVQSCKGQCKGPERRLLRSVGMGGTASPLLWCMGYDPLISALSSITADDDPAYVDNLAALLSSMKQTLRAAIALPWAARAAGLLVEAHRCRGIRTAGSEALREALEEVPVHFEQDGDSVLITGLPGELILALLTGGVDQHAIGSC